MDNGKGELIVAVATDDGESLIDRHFGDAGQFVLFSVNQLNARRIGEVVNTVEEDPTLHADPEKARGITGLLQQAGVTVVVSKIFGPNIKRIRKKFVCVVSNGPAINTALASVVKNFTEVTAEWNRGEERSHLTYR